MLGCTKFERDGLATFSPSRGKNQKQTLNNSFCSVLFKIIEEWELPTHGLQKVTVIERTVSNWPHSA